MQTAAIHEGGLQRGLYDPSFSRRTYARLIECAESCLHSGVDVIVDAAFLAGEERRLFSNLAKRKGIPFIIVQCQADPEVLARHILQRQQMRLDPSDADVGVLNWQLQETQPLSAEERSHAILVDTTKPEAMQNACTAIRDRLDRRPGTATPTQ